MWKILTSHSLEYLMTMLLHCLLYSAMPILATSSGPLIPRVLSISYSCKKPNQAWVTWAKGLTCRSAQPRFLPQASRGSPSRISGPHGSHSDGQSGWQCPWWCQQGCARSAVSPWRMEGHHRRCTWIRNGERCSQCLKNIYLKYSFEETPE